jgi:hypothetical protein
MEGGQQDREIFFPFLPVVNVKIPSHANLSTLKFSIVEVRSVQIAGQLSVACVVTIDWLVSVFEVLHRLLCYNDFQRYCHGLLVTR